MGSSKMIENVPRAAKAMAEFIEKCGEPVIENWDTEEWYLEQLFQGVEV